MKPISIKPSTTHYSTSEARQKVKSLETMDLEQRLQTSAQEFLNGNRLYIDPDVMRRLQDYLKITWEEYNSYGPLAVWEKNNAIEKLHQKIKPYLEEIAKGNTRFNKPR